MILERTDWRGWSLCLKAEKNTRLGKITEKVKQWRMDRNMELDVDLDIYAGSSKKGGQARGIRIWSRICTGTVMRALAKYQTWQAA